MQDFEIQVQTSTIFCQNLEPKVFFLRQYLWNCVPTARTNTSLHSNEAWHLEHVSKFCEKSVQGLTRYKGLLSTAISITIFTKTNDAANKRNSQGYLNSMSRIIEVDVII